MTRRSEFRVISAARKPEPAKRQRNPKPPSFVVAHRILGDGVLIGLRLSDSGHYIGEIDFNGARRLLRLEQAYFTTPVTDIIAVAHEFALASPKPVGEKMEVRKRGAVEDPADHEASGGGADDMEVA
jgi:hypothetical protein